MFVDTPVQSSCDWASVLNWPSTVMNMQLLEVRGIWICNWVEGTVSGLWISKSHEGAH